jgi:predicted transcriptional regulator
MPTLTIELSQETADALSRHAAERSTTPQHLLSEAARRLVEEDVIPGTGITKAELEQRIASADAGRVVDAKVALRRIAARHGIELNLRRGDE